MTGTQTAIARWHTRYISQVPVPDGTVANWQDALAGLDEATLCDGLVRPGEWLLIRRLPIQARWTPNSGDQDVRNRWLSALRGALEAALAVPNPDVVRYTARRHAFADLFYRCALGERHRAWAWVQLGLVPHSGLTTDELMHRASDALLGMPTLIWPVLQYLIAADAGTGAFSAVLTRLPEADWRRWLDAAPQTQPYRAAGHATGSSHASDWPRRAAVTSVLRWIDGHGHLAQRHIDILAVVLAATAWPAGGNPPSVLRKRLALASQRCLQAEPPLALSRVYGAGPPSGSRVSVSDTDGPPPSNAPGFNEDGRQPPVAPPRETGSGTAATTAAVPDSSLPFAPGLPNCEEWVETAWGGALFWLSRVPQSGAIQWLATSPVDDADGLSHLLRALANGLGVPDDDAALRAFCGDYPPGGDTPREVSEYAGAVVCEWEHWLAHAAPDLPQPRMEYVCRRSGRIRFEPGWITLQLPLEGIDTTVRRLGLDLDPGWLPWLGCVLRIRYD